MNILRSTMVKQAQKGIPEGKIFNANRERLKLIGSEKLQEMLDGRDWSPLYMSGLMRNSLNSYHHMINNLDYNGDEIDEIYEQTIDESKGEGECNSLDAELSEADLVQLAEKWLSQQ